MAIGWPPASLVSTAANQASGSTPLNLQISTSDAPRHTLRSILLKEGFPEPVKRVMTKPKSKKQPMAVGAALAAKRGDKPESRLRGASKQMAKSMSEKELDDRAATKRKVLPTRTWKG